MLTPAQVHIVHFDSADKITQIRQYWDQGALLKQIDDVLEGAIERDPGKTKSPATRDFG